MSSEHKETKGLSSQASFYFLGKVAAMAVTFLVPVVLVRIFSKSEYGQYAQIILLFTFSLRVLQFGIRQSLFYHLPSQRENRSYFVSNAYVIFMAVGLVFFAALTALREPLAHLMGADELVMLLPLCGLLTLFMLVSSPFESVLIIDSKAEKASAVVFLSEVLRGAFVVAFVLINKSLLSALLGLVCFSFLRFMAYSYVVFAHFGFRLERKNLTHFREQLNYAVPIGFSGILANTAKRMDKLIMAAFFGPEIYAIYSAGSFKAPVIKTFFRSVGEVMLPRAVRLLKDNKVDQFVELWRALLVRFFFVGCAAFFALQLVAHDLITLIFTDEYAASVPIFRILLFLLFGEMFRYGLILRTLGNTKAILKSNLMAFVVSVPLTLVMVQNFGPIGAACSALIAYSINSISQLRYSVIGLERKVTDIFPIQSLLQFLAIGGTLLVILWTGQPLIDNKVLRVVIFGSTFVIAYTMCCKQAQIFNIFAEKPVRKVLVKLNLAKVAG